MSPAAGNMPAAEVEVDEALIAALLGEQFPGLATRTIRRVANGWDNVVFRLGDDLCVRAPRRGAGAELIAHEQRWLPQLAPSLPLPAPAPLHVGAPGHGYPWTWSICPWFDGDPAATHPPNDLVAAAEQLAAFVTALHREAPSDAPTNAVRGVSVGSRVPAWEDALERIHGPVAARDVWSRGVAAPRFAGPPLWIHGDLHPANLVVRDGRIVAVIDFGDMAKGDPASDLAVAWMLLDAAGRRRFKELTERDDATWIRARAWAAGLGAVMIANSADNPVIRGVGERSLREALADTGDG